MIDHRQLLPSEVARCGYCLRDLTVGEAHHYDTDNAEVWCDDCDDPAWHEEVTA